MKRDPSFKWLRDREGAADRVKAWKAAGERVVFTNGCFDILHPGHIELLSKAAALGERLIVGLNSDRSVKSLQKGTERPVMDEASRARVLAALEMLDAVVTFDENTPFGLIQELMPDVLVKGGDYDKDAVVGREVVEANGGELVLIPLLQGYSTSSIIDRIKKIDDKGEEG